MRGAGVTISPTCNVLVDFNTNKFSSVFFVSKVHFSSVQILLQCISMRIVSPVHIGKYARIQEILPTTV